MKKPTTMHIWWINQFAAKSCEPGGGRHVQMANALSNLGCTTTIVSASNNYMTNQHASLLDADCDGVDRFVQLQVGWRGPGGIGKIGKMVSFGRKVVRGRWIESVKRPDVVIGSTPSLHAAAAAATIAQRYNVPFVLEIRDLWPLSLIEVAGISPRNPVIQWLYRIERTVVSRAARIISLLQNADKYLEKYSVTTDRIDWIPNGVDGHLFSSSTNKHNGNGIVVMYAGSHGAPNGLHTIIDAAKIIQLQRSNITFRFVGDGTSKKKLQQYATAEGVTSITFEEAVPRTEIPNLLASADILVANTPNHDLYRYGTSLNKLYEYLAAARPIALASSAVGEPITAAGVGPVVPPDDPDALAERIITLASLSEDERDELGIKGRQYVEQEHDFKQLAKQVLLCLQRVVHS